MKPEIKKLWVDALLSGEYQQGEGYLHQIEDGVPKFCCLGVLTDLAIKNGVDIKIGEIYNFVSTFDSAFQSLPESVMEWSGMDSPNGDFYYTISYKSQDIDGSFSLEEEVINTSLAELNDGGSSFAEIVLDINKYF